VNRAVTEDLLLGGRVRLRQPARGYRVAVDAVLLAAAVPARPGERVLDLGCGVGAVALCLAARVADLHLTGVEVQPPLATLARENADSNGLSDRFAVIEHDLARAWPGSFGTFDHIATNPPYLAAAVADPSPDPVKARATVESTADLARWIARAGEVLAPGGTLTVVHRSDRLGELEAALEAAGLQARASRLVEPSRRVLVRAARGAARRIVATPLSLQSAGGYTQEAEAILRDAAALAF